MHQTPAESRQFVSDLAAALKSSFAENVPGPLFIIPPFTSLSGLADAAHAAGVWLGAQNMHWAEEGAYTGEISARMLRAVGVDLVLLGHAERRRYFNETDHDVRQKVGQALRHELRVLLCIGETAEEKGAGATSAVLERQLKIALQDVPADHLPKLMLAYEPIWAIGDSGTPAAPDAIAVAAETIRATLFGQFGTAAAAVPLLYGGSVNVDNCGGYARLPGIDGLFVGRAAWTVNGFVALLRAGLSDSW